MNRTMVAIAALGLGLVSSNAGAFLIQNAYESFDFSWSYLADEYDLTGTGTVTVAGITDDSLTLQFSLTNKTVADSGVDARLTAFGFGIDPNATGVYFYDDPNDSGMVSASLDNIPSLKTIEVCALGEVNCPGGADGGIFANGASDIFSLKLTGAFAKGATIDPLGYKYQTDEGSYEFSCSTTDTTNECSGGSTVPEPGILALVGVAVAGMSFTRRRKLN